MGQVKTVGKTARWTMGRAAFMQGYREARKGLPMDYDVYTEGGRTNDRWQYERGRQFALLYAGTVKQGNRVLPEAQRAFIQAVYSHLIR